MKADRQQALVVVRLSLAAEFFKAAESSNAIESRREFQCNRKPPRIPMQFDPLLKSEKVTLVLEGIGDDNRATCFGWDRAPVTIRRARA